MVAPSKKWFHVRNDSLTQQTTMPQRSCARRIRAIAFIASLCPVTALAQSTANLAPVTSAPAQSEEVCSTDGISTVVRCIWHDVRQIGSRQPLTWLAAGGAVAAGSLLLDHEVLQFMSDRDQDPSVAVGENLGEAGLHFGAPAVLYLLAHTTGHHGLAAFSVTMIRTQMVNGILTRSIKLFPRPRPYQEAATPTKGSFPSGHTSAAFASATVITRRWGPRAGIPAFAVATFVGATRLQNLHYLSDVTFGVALGVASGLVVQMPTLSKVHARLVPIVGSGVTGIALSLGD
jgi:membrane-associated phospholipid phosphatase